MTITRTEEYQKELLIILKHIANEQISNISTFPYKYLK